VISFVDAINHGDVDRLAALMAPDHRLQVLDEEPRDGKEANVEAWRGYVTSYPGYVVVPHSIAARDSEVIVLGHTLGSHLGLPDDEESALSVIWRANVVDGLLTLWQILDDTPFQRDQLGLPA
jgi:hypothetical protein